MSKDPTIKNIKQEIESSNLQLVNDLTNRFLIDLQLNMLFHIFNYVCREIDQDMIDGSATDSFLKGYHHEDENTSKHARNFFNHWLAATKKEIKKEVYEINNKLKNKELSFIGAISSFSLPSTEDYQRIYNEAFKNVKKFYEKGTSRK